MRGRIILAAAALAVAGLALARSAGAQPCLIFVYGKQTDTNTFTSYSAARNY